MQSVLFLFQLFKKVVIAQVQLLVCVLVPHAVPQIEMAPGLTSAGSPRPLKSCGTFTHFTATMKPE